MKRFIFALAVWPALAIGQVPQQEIDACKSKWCFFSETLNETTCDPLSFRGCLADAVHTAAWQQPGVSPEAFCTKKTPERPINEYECKRMVTLIRADQHQQALRLEQQRHEFERTRPEREAAAAREAEATRVKAEEEEARRLAAAKAEEQRQAIAPRGRGAEPDQQIIATNMVLAYRRYRLAGLMQMEKACWSQAARERDEWKVTECMRMSITGSLIDRAASMREARGASDFYSGHMLKRMTAGSVGAGIAEARSNQLMGWVMGRFVEIAHSVEATGF